MSNSPHEELVKVIFDLERDEDGYPPADYEHLWAKPLGGDLYLLDNTPFFVRGISTGDVVAAQADENGDLRYSGMSKPSGHSTLRVVVFRASPDPRPIEERVREVRGQLERLGCSSELAHLPGLFAVDIPPGIPLDPVISALADGESRELWTYEESALRH